MCRLKKLIDPEKKVKDESIIKKPDVDINNDNMNDEVDDEILISAATVDDIEIVSAITAAEIGVRTNTSVQSENEQVTTYQTVSGGYV